jgi:DNA ligase (NAD+)
MNSEVEAKEIIRLIKNYAKTWSLLLAYDEGRFPLIKSGYQGQPLDYQQMKVAIELLKTELVRKKEATALFAREFDNRFAATLGAIEQTFLSKPLYGSVQEKAAHLLYFIIKDHPFIDGNKRVGCFLFLLYLQLHRLPLVLDDGALLLLALLIAESVPAQKDMMIRLVVNLLLP